MTVSKAFARSSVSEDHLREYRIWNDTLSRWFDRRVVDGAVNGVATATSSGGRGLRRIQTGRVQNYALGIALGLIVMTILYLAVAG